MERRRTSTGRRVLIVALAALALAALGVGVWRLRAAARPAPAERAARVERATLQVAVSASGTVEPQAQVGLAFAMPGPVEAVLVQVGDQVQAGDVLARQDTARLRLQVEQARAALAAAEARLAQLQAGPLPEQVAAAEANLRAAEAQLSAAVADRDRLLKGASQAELAAAEAELAAAQADQRAAEDLHNMTMKCKTVKLPTSEEMLICPGLGPAEEQARQNLEIANSALAAAQARYDELLAGANRAAVRAAQANVAAAEAQRDAAQAQLDLLLAGPTSAQIATAKAQVEQAQAALAQAELGLEQALLRAPFGGIVAEVNLTVGALAPGARADVVLVDPARFHVTVGVDELDVARLQVGQQAEVTLDALPGVPLSGTIERISPGATLEGGVVSYQVTVALSPTDQPVRAGMTANVRVVTEERRNVLAIPTWVVRVDRTTGQTYVERRTPTGLERVDVALGIRDAGLVEVLDGLAEGDECVLVSNGSQVFSFGG
jgi:HlyD family secretion protein